MSRLVRFIRFSKEFSTDEATGAIRIKQDAIAPMYNQQKNQYETSCLKDMAKADEELHQIGVKMLVTPSSPHLKGHSIFDIEIIEKEGLNFNHDGEGHEDHGLVVGWPGDMVEIIKTAKAIAKAITASESTRTKIYGK